MICAIGRLDAWPWEPGMVGLRILLSQGGTLSTHLVAPKKWTCHMVGKTYNLDKYTKLKLYIHFTQYFCAHNFILILVLPEIEEAILLSLGLNLDWIF